jgi:transcriptional regulator with XRE-family HTH domain
LLDEICGAIRRSGMNPETIARHAQVSNATLSFWLRGQTKSPRIGTLEKVAAALGCRITMVEDRFALAPIDRVPPPPQKSRIPRMAIWLRQ